MRKGASGGANPGRAMSAAMLGAFARATMRAPEIKHSPRRVVVGVRESASVTCLLGCPFSAWKEEPTIQISVSSTLTVYHDGQFWVGLAEHVEGGRYGVARIAFGAEPSDEEILQFVVGK